MNNGQATVLEKEKAIPMPAESFDDAKILDWHGDTVQPRKLAAIEQIDKRMSEPVTLSKGTLWLLGAGATLLILASSYGGSLLTWARNDQTQIERQIQMQADMKKMAQDQQMLVQELKMIGDRLREQEILSSKVEGFKAGVAETQSKR